MKKIIPILAFIFLWTSFAWAQLDQGGDQQFEGFNLQGYDDDGNKSWDVKGDTADVVGAEIQLTNVNANSYGDQPMNVTADRGMVNQLSGNMRLEEDVIITSEDGSTIMSDKLEWDKNNDIVRSEDEVFIKNKQLSATGRGMQAQPGLKTATLNRDVTVKVDPEQNSQNKNQLVTITSDGPMVIDQILSKARFEENVVAVQQDQTLKADVVEIFFNEDMQSFKKIVCIGNVEIIRGDNKTYAEKATYDALDQKIILSGRPKLIFETGGDNGFTAFGN